MNYYSVSLSILQSFVLLLVSMEELVLVLCLALVHSLTQELTAQQVIVLLAVFTFTEPCRILPN